MRFVLFKKGIKNFQIKLLTYNVTIQYVNM